MIHSNNNPPSEPNQNRPTNHRDQGQGRDGNKSEKNSSQLEKLKIRQKIESLRQKVSQFGPVQRIIHYFGRRKSTHDQASSTQIKQLELDFENISQVKGEGLRNLDSLQGKQAQKVFSQAESISAHIHHSHKNNINWKKISKYTLIGVSSAGVIIFGLPVVLTGVGIGTVGLAGGVVSGLASNAIPGTYTFAHAASLGLVNALPTSTIASQIIVLQSTALGGISAIGAVLASRIRTKKNQQPFQKPDTDFVLTIDPSLTQQARSEFMDSHPQISQNHKNAVESMINVTYFDLVRTGQIKYGENLPDEFIVYGYNNDEPISIQEFYALLESSIGSSTELVDDNEQYSIHSNNSQKTLNKEQTKKALQKAKALRRSLREFRYNFEKCHDLIPSEKRNTYMEEFNKAYSIVEDFTAKGLKNKNDRVLSLMLQNGDILRHRFDKYTKELQNVTQSKQGNNT